MFMPLASLRRFVECDELLLKDVRSFILIFAKNKTIEKSREHILWSLTICKHVVVSWSKHYFPF